jgi:hypothetical protein
MELFGSLDNPDNIVLIPATGYFKKIYRRCFKRKK